MYQRESLALAQTDFNLMNNFTRYLQGRKSHASLWYQQQTELVDLGRSSPGWSISSFPISPWRMERVSPWLFHSFLWGWESCSHSPPPRAPSPRRRLSPPGARSWPPRWRRGGWKSANTVGPIGRHKSLGSGRGSHQTCGSAAPRTPHTCWSPPGCSRRICLWVRTPRRDCRRHPGSRSHCWNPDSGTWWCSSGHPRTPPLAEGTVLWSKDSRNNIYWAFTFYAGHQAKSFTCLVPFNPQQKPLLDWKCCFLLSSEKTEPEEKLDDSSQSLSNSMVKLGFQAKCVRIQAKLLATLSPRLVSTLSFKERHVVSLHGKGQDTQLPLPSFWL